MKKLFVAAALAVIASGAYAAKDNSGCQGNCPTTGAGIGTVNNAGGAGGNGYGGTGIGVGMGGAGGQGGAGGSVLGSGNSANANTNVSHGGAGGAGGSVLGSGNSNNSNRNDNTNLNSNTNKQGQGQAQGQQQGQAQGQGQQQSANNKQGQGQSQVNGNNDNRSNASNRNSNAAQGNTTNTSVQVAGDNVVYEAARIPVATAYAAGLTASNGTCMGSTSAGGQGMSFGFSVGTTWKDAGCDRRYNAQALAAVGQGKAAVALLCQDADIALAMEVAGTPCARPAAAPTKVSAVTPADQASLDAKNTDPIIRARLGLPPLAK